MATVPREPDRPYQAAEMDRRHAAGGDLVEDDVPAGDPPGFFGGRAHDRGIFYGAKVRFERAKPHELWLASALLPGRLASSGSIVLGLGPPVVRGRCDT